MDRNKIIDLCTQIKKTIDWEFDSYSGYQEMMDTIDELADTIIEEVKL